MQKKAGGSVLILALWVLFFLAAITVAVGAHVGAALMTAQRLKERVEARMFAAAGAAQAAAAVMNRPHEWDGLASTAWNRDEDVFREVTLDEGLFSVVFITNGEGGDGAVTNYGILGEESRVNLNRALENGKPRLVLHELFVLVGGLDAGEAQRLTGIVADKLTTDREKPYCSTVEDLLRVPEVGSLLFYRVAPYLTVYGSGLVNVNSASERVLVAAARAAAEGRPERVASQLAAKIGRFRQAGHGFEREDYAHMRGQLDGFEKLSPEEDAVFMAMMGQVTVRSTAFRGIAYGGGRGMQGQAPIEVEFVWDRDKREYVMWREQ